MAAQAHTAHVTPKQLAADRANLAKARKVAKGLPRTAKQQAASRHNLVHARAAQKTRRQGKKPVTPVTKKKPKAPLPGILMSSGDPGLSPTIPAGIPEAPMVNPQVSGGTGSIPAQRQASGEPIPCHLPPEGLHALPACAAVALAASLGYWAGAEATLDEILALHARTSGDVTLADLLELAAAEGFCGHRLESFRPADPDTPVPGLLYGLGTPGGYHAVLAAERGMLSWGQELPWLAEPEEAWWLEWGMP